MLNEVINARTSENSILDFRTHPDQYHHWSIKYSGQIAELIMNVAEDQTAFDGYELKLNSYDIGVDIELYDAVQRLRIEHPEVKTVVLRSGKDNIFCAGANIRMLGTATHGHKVNFCKFTNETRNSIEDASQFSGQRYLCAINGVAAGGGYELALANDYIMLMDDGNAAVSLPEVPLLAVLPGTGGLTRVVDKRKVRRDYADIFCTLEEGIKGQRAVDWRLVDEIVPRSKYEDRIMEKANQLAEDSKRPDNSNGISLNKIERDISIDKIDYQYVSLIIDRKINNVSLVIKTPKQMCAESIDKVMSEGDLFWPLALVRQLDDAILHLRFNEPTIGTINYKTSGDTDIVNSYDSFLRKHADHWLINEILLYWKRTLKRIDLTSRSGFALVEQGSCFTGFLAEILFAADRCYMLDGQLENNDAPVATITLTESNFGPFPMSNGITRLQTRFLGEPMSVEMTRNSIGTALDASAAMKLGLVTFIPDDLDWADEIRILDEERASYSPDALTGMEANLRFAGPETMETKIFGRLTAWQNWIFQRPNAVSEKGALKKYGTGSRPDYDNKRV
ncbi:MAG: 2,3-epoxybenzoyl-CoA dihydrolase [Gammaproteobacteria bacterium]|jgi:benzoyl-CoA-dihydrodiol lyase